MVSLGHFAHRRARTRSPFSRAREIGATLRRHGAPVRGELGLSLLWLILRSTF